MTESAKQLPVLPPQLTQADPSGDLARRIGEFRQSIVAAAGSNLVSLVIFGGVARGRYRPGWSDVNALVVLETAGTRELKQLAPVLRAAFRSIRLEPMILTRKDVAAIGATFPTKLLDIKEHHLLLAGQDVLSGIMVSRERVLIRIEQELRNLALRLRARAAMSIDDPPVLITYLAATARSIAIELASLLRISGEAVPEEDRTVAVYAQSSRVFGLNALALTELAAIRADRTAPPDITSTIDGVLAALDVAADVAAKMPR